MKMVFSVESEDKYVRDQETQFETIFRKRYSTVFALHGSNVGVSVPSK